MAFDDPARPSIYPPPTPTPPPEPPPRRAGCWTIGLAILVIVALVGSTAYGAFYFLRQELLAAQRETAVATPITAAPDTIAAEDTLPEIAATSTPNPNRVNRIVIVNDDGQIETMAPDGSEQRQLTDVVFNFQFPAWSPDATAVAAIGASRASSSIFLLPDTAAANIEDPIQIYRENNYSPFYLYWSPDGEQISFLASHVSRGMTLNVVPAAAGSTRSELLQGSPIYWQWTANGQQMLLHSGVASDDSRLTFLSPTDLENSADDLANPGLFQVPGISANGRYLAYAESVNGDNSQLVIADTTSGGQQEVRHAGLVAMGWSPTSDLLAFTSGRPDSDNFWGELQLFDAETGDVRLLSRNLVVGFFWSPDGRSLAVISAPQDNGEIIAAAPWGAQDSANRLGKRVQQGHSFNFTLTVIDVASGEGRVLGEFEPTFLFLSQFLPFFDQYALSHRIWSPDSDALVLPVREGSRSMIYVYPADGSAKQLLAEGTMAFWSPQ